MEEKRISSRKTRVGKVISVVIRTAVDQKLTYDVKRDILECLMALDGITPDEAELLRDLDASKKG